MPLLLHEIVRTILSTEPDVEARADVLIIAEPRRTTDDYASILYAHPQLRLVAINDDRRHAVLYELRPCRALLGELSPESLVRAVRGQAATVGGS